MAVKKALFFTAGATATAAELALVTRLAHRGYSVGVRNGLRDPLYGARLESADAVAGTLPANITSALGTYADGDVTPTDSAKAEAMKLMPNAASATFSHLATLQLTAVKADLVEDETNSIAITEITRDANIAYGTSDASKATVNATGLVTGVAAGTATITATYTYAVGKTQTATLLVTLT